MPLYEYRCQTCQKDFTLLQSNSVDKNETVCPDCGENVQYKMSTFSAKIQGAPVFKKGPVTADELPNKDVLNLPIPRLRSEL